MRVLILIGFLALLSACANVRLEKQPAKYKGLHLRSFGFCVSEKYYVSVIPTFKIISYTNTSVSNLSCTNKVKEIRYEAIPVEPKYVCTQSQTGMRCVPKNRTDKIEIINPTQ